MKIVILDRATLGPGIDLAALEALGELTVYDTTTEAELPARIRDAEVIVSNKLKLNRNNLPGAEKLKLICVTATGYDCIDTAWCRERGIGVCNVPGYSTESVAQLTLTMVLALAAHLREYRAFVDSGDYTRSGVANSLVPVWGELKGKTWGILGGGNIARRVAELAKAFGCHVILCRQAPETEYEAVDLDTLCARSDILTIHVPLTDRTRGMIGKAQLERMKPGVMLVNVARGAVCDELALTEAVEDGTIGALGVDVYSVEPFPAEHPFNRILGRDNVCLTPHMAWGAVEARNRCMTIVAENIRDFAQGKRSNRVE